MNVDEMVKALRAPLPVDEIYWRVGAKTQDKSRGLALAYMDARGVMNRLDEVFGVEHWQDAYVETPTNRIICTLSVRFTDEWIQKSDGAGMTDVEGEKGAISDALKRTAVKFGIGRYLYHLPAVWVPIESYGRSHRIVRGEEPELPEWARPAGAPPAGQKKAPELTEPTQEQREAFGAAVRKLTLQLDNQKTEETADKLFDEALSDLGFRSIGDITDNGLRGDHESFYKELAAHLEVTE